MTRLPISDDPHVLDLSNRGLKRLEKRDGVGVEKLSLDHNELAKLENIECFLDVQKVSLLCLITCLRLLFKIILGHAGRYH